MSFLYAQTRGFYPMLQSLARSGVQAAGLLQETMVAPAVQRSTLASRLKQLERQADATVRELMQRIGNTHVTPFEREDLHWLISALDDVVDSMEASADLLVLLHCAELPPEFAALGDALGDGSAALAEAVGCLPSLRGIEPHLAAVHRIEDEADHAYRWLLSTLFTGSFEALDVVRYKAVADEMEASVDSMERAAAVLEAVRAGL